jgi:hypothetical protein
MPMFAKRHYETIAMAIQIASHYCKTEDQRRGVEHVRNELSAMFTRDHPDFNDVRFYEACKPGANVSAR